MQNETKQTSEILLKIESDDIEDCFSGFGEEVQLETNEGTNLEKQISTQLCRKTLTILVKLPLMFHICFRDKCE